MTVIDTDLLPIGYRAGGYQRKGVLIVIEGVGGSGKSTVGRLLARRLDGVVLHTAPEPIAFMQQHINERCRALPHALYYLAGALHVSDLARTALEGGTVVIDRYTGSLLANHSAVLNTSMQETEELIAPFRHYLLDPDLTVYLDATAADVAERTTIRRTKDPDAREPLTNERLVNFIRGRFARLADRDPTGVSIDTHGTDPDAVVERVARMLKVAGQD